MNYLSRLALRAGVAAAAVAFANVTLVQAEQTQPAIRLVKTGASATGAASATAPAQPGDDVRENYRVFARTKVGESSPSEEFTLAFARPSTITRISETGDFEVAGGSCTEDHTYIAGDRCTVEVVFAAKGPGHRTGWLKVESSADAMPLLVPTGGDAYGPALSFVPAIITTVSGTYPGSAGLLKNPQGLAVDGGDSLYMADTGNNLIRYRDSSGIVTTIAGGGTNAAQAYVGSSTGVQLSQPYGVAVNQLGLVLVSDSGNMVVRQVADGLAVVPVAGAGTETDCYPASPCNPANVSTLSPYGIVEDAGDRIFANYQLAGGGEQVAEMNLNPGGGAATFWYVPTIGQQVSTSDYPLALDSGDNLYFVLEYPGGVLAGIPAGPLCQIWAQGLNGNELGYDSWIVAGTLHCGYSGDGGLASGAEISSSVQGFGWDQAGNFYFTDTGNQRVRRIDGQTGVIRTVAGNGTAGYAGDNSPSTSAELDAPTGLAVDSQGHVFITNLTGPSGSAVVREIGGTGMQTFSTQTVGTSSAAKTVLISNVGNDTLTFTHTGFSSGNTGDFSIDPNSTSCNFTIPLYSGTNCNIGFIFTPSAAGTRSATFTIEDSTLSGTNTISVTGSGVAPAAAVLTPTALTFASQIEGTTSASQPIKLSNPGGLPLTISSYGFSGTNPTYFGETNTCAATLAAGVYCTINVTFSPTGAGSPSATLTVTTSAGKVTASLNGISAAAIKKPKVTLKSKANPATAGEALALAVEVVGGSPVPTGKVQLKDGGKVLAEAALSSGAVSFSAKLTAGTHELTAWYLGDKSHAAAESEAVKEIVR